MKHLLGVLAVGALALAGRQAEAQMAPQGGYFYNQSQVSSQYSYEEETFVQTVQWTNMCIYSVPVWYPQWQQQYNYQCGYQTYQTYCGGMAQQVCTRRSWWYLSWIRRDYQYKDYCH